MDTIEELFVLRVDNTTEATLWEKQQDVHARVVFKRVVTLGVGDKIMALMADGTTKPVFINDTSVVLYISSLVFHD